MAIRQLRLRRPGTCAVCLLPLDAGAIATWDSERRTVTCSTCTEDGSRSVKSGLAGASASAEAKRRRDRQQERRRHDIERRPILGRLAWALDPEPDAGRSYAKGAVGEQRLGAALDELNDAGVFNLHDRRLPRSKANIDHLAVTANGVWVIDAKRYTGRVATVDKGGWFRTDLRLTVAGRDRTKLVTGVHKQVAQVSDALAPSFVDVKVHGVLCFVDAEWGLFTKPFVVDGVLVTWGKALTTRLIQAGPIDQDQRLAISRTIASAFPPAS